MFVAHARRDGSSASPKHTVGRSSRVFALNSGVVKIATWTSGLESLIGEGLIRTCTTQSRSDPSILPSPSLSRPSDTDLAGPRVRP